MAAHINQFLQTLLPKEHQWKVTLMQKWDSIIGNLKGRVRIERIHDKVLVLGVCHPAWAQELYMLSGVLRDKINKAINEDRIKQIRFKTVSLKKTTQQPTEESAAPSTVLRAHKAIFTKRQQEKLAEIKNDELRLVLREYFMRCHETKKRRNRAKKPKSVRQSPR